jgi:hypothetical protein
MHSYLACIWRFFSFVVCHVNLFDKGMAISSAFTTMNFFYISSAIGSLRSVLVAIVYADRP